MPLAGPLVLSALDRGRAADDGARGTRLHRSRPANCASRLPRQWQPTSAALAALRCHIVLVVLEVGGRWSGCREPHLLRCELSLRRREPSGAPRRRPRAAAGTGRSGSSAPTAPASRRCASAPSGSRRTRPAASCQAASGSTTTRRLRAPMPELVQRAGILLQESHTQITSGAPSVWEEIAFGPRNLSLPLDEVIERTWRAVDALRLRELIDRDPSQPVGRPGAARRARRGAGAGSALPRSRRAHVTARSPRNAAGRRDARGRGESQRRRHPHRRAQDRPAGATV